MSVQEDILVQTGMGSAAGVRDAPGATGQIGGIARALTCPVMRP